MEETKDLTEGKILSSLIKFALPVLLALFLQSLYGGVDLLVVGQFAETADVSGVATGSTLMQTLTMVITGLAMGITILVGQRIGEKNPEEAGKAIGSGIYLFIIVGVILTIVLGVCADGLAQLLHAPVEAFSHTRIYIRICGLGSMFIVAYNVLGAIFRGIGDSKTPLITVCIACVLNIVGDLLFVAVFHMGASGAALATVISQAVSVIISMVIISKKDLPFKLTKDSLRMDASTIGKELQLGIPIALQEFLVGISFLAIQTIVNSIDVISSAGVGVAEKVCAFIMLVPSAYMQSMAAFVAQNMGANKADRAKKALIYGILTSLAVGVVMGTFTFICGDLLAGIFAKDSAVIAAAHDYLRAYAIDAFLTAILFCMIGYYNGCGNTLFVMIQGIVGAIGVRLPVVYFMSQIEGASLFMIGLGTPAATIVQILMCLLFMTYLNMRKNHLPDDTGSSPK